MELELKAKNLKDNRVYKIKASFEALREPSTAHVNVTPNDETANYLKEKLIQSLTQPLPDLRIDRDKAEITHTPLYKVKANLEDILMAISTALELTLNGDSEEWIVLPKVKLPFLIAFDFDGILVDGNYELFKLGSEVLEKLFRARVPQSAYNTFWKLRSQAPNLKKIFQLLVRLSDRKDIATEENYQKFRDSFFNLRNHYISERTQEWIATFKPIDHVINQVSILKERFRKVVIVSMREERSLKVIVQALSLDFSDDEVHGTKVDEDIKGKTFILGKLAEEHNLPRSNVVLIDDSPSNVREAISQGFRGILGIWLRREEAPPDLSAIQGEDLFREVKNILLKEVTYWDL